MAEKTIEEQLNDAVELVEKLEKKLSTETKRADTAEKELESLKAKAQEKNLTSSLEVEPNCFGKYPKKVEKKCRVCKFAQKCKNK